MHDGDRIVFVGDSITGQGGRMPQGWTHLMSEALATIHPAAAPTLIALGGSGQTVGSWQNVEKKSREQSLMLDVPDVDVKASLDQHADVLVIMLGMNDVLSPSLDGSEAGFDKWAEQYRALVAALRERTTPRLLALATVPVCTEDEQSPKNRAIAALTKRIDALALAEHAVVLPVHAGLLETLGQGRTLSPDFHVTNDLVHPNGAGHVAIARAMLRGLGETVAARNLFEQHAAAQWPKKAADLPVLSYAVEYEPTPLDRDTQSCKVRFWWTSALPGQKAAPLSPKVGLSVPEGWSVEPASIAAASGEFTVTGPFDRLKNTLVLRGSDGSKSCQTEVALPAPWLVGAGGLRQMVWADKNSRFDPEKGRLKIDDVLLSGKGWGEPGELAAGYPLRWLRHHPSVNYLGGAQADSVDMMGVTFFQSFEVGYGARWVYSGRERTVRLKVGSRAFGGNDYLAVWMNSQNVYGGQIMPDRGKIIEAGLHKGWNLLAFKSNHLQWQWHFSIELVETDDQQDLRFSVVPHPMTLP